MKSRRLFRKLGLPLTVLIVCVVILGVGLPAQADLLVVAVEQGSLPASLSLHSLKNSPHSLDNSVHSLSNSVHSLDNSPHSLDNSRHSRDNGKSGSRRLLAKQDGDYNYVGYYVAADSGVTNFYSVEGERLFYSPSGTEAVFSSEEGDFSGGLASLDGETVLALVETGQFAMAKSGGNIFSPSGGGMGSVSYFRGYRCTKDCSGHIAGYRWALEKGLKNSSQCSGKSVSFIEGCASVFVQGTEKGSSSSSSEVIRSQIDGDFEGFEGETIVKLMNGQIWQQSEYWYHYHYSYMPEVIIMNTSGGHKMVVDGIDKAVRVTRLK